jgi:hypothetical protein
MDRRSFFGIAAGLVLAPGLRAQNCAVVPPGITVCSVSVDIPQLIESIHEQECPQWFWAASASMIFDFYGHPVDQKEIVKQVYGSEVCFPAGSTTTMGNVLSRVWKDDNGKRFKSTVVAAYDPANGIYAIDNATIVNLLKSDNPLLYCNTHHAMVLYGVMFVPTMPEPNIQRVDVVDPWPPSPRAHPLSQPEIYAVNLGGQMTFLASVRLTDLEDDDN